MNFYWKVVDLLRFILQIASSEVSMDVAADKGSPQSHLFDPGSPYRASHVGWICCWFSPCSETFSPGSPAFLSSTKSNVERWNTISRLSSPKYSGQTRGLTCKQWKRNFQLHPELRARPQHEVKTQIFHCERFTLSLPASLFEPQYLVLTFSFVDKTFCGVVEIAVKSYSTFPLEALLVCYSSRQKVFSLRRL